MTWRRREQDLHILRPALRLTNARSVFAERSLANADFILAVQNGEVSKPKA